MTYVMSWGLFELDIAQLLCASGHSVMSCLLTILRLPMFTMRSLQDASSGSNASLAESDDQQVPLIVSMSSLRKAVFHRQGLTE